MYKKLYSSLKKVLALFEDFLSRNLARSMGSFSEDFMSLERNVRQLIQKNKATDEALNETKKAFEELKQKSIQQEKEIEELIEKNKILRIAGGTTEGSSREIKFKINEIVREVDKCIAQLNQ